MSKEKERKATTRKTRAVQSMSVVQQSLTTEVVKENLTREERAREYANSVLPYANDIDAGYEQRMAWNNARLGYLSALKDSEKELKAYREALTELIYASINTCDMQSYNRGEEIPEDAWDKNIDYLRDKAEQAKQLLEE